ALAGPAVRVDHRTHHLGHRCVRDSRRALYPRAGTGPQSTGAGAGPVLHRVQPGVGRRAVLEWRTGWRRNDRLATGGDPCADRHDARSMVAPAHQRVAVQARKQFAHSEGRYNATLHDAALAFTDRAGFDVKQTFIDGGYDVAEEVQKFLWADVIVWQMPGWWMGAPWTVKKYIDEVFTEGYGSLYAN
nr:hypothetical protein [Tanacetum cinerariifolium]